MSAPLVVAIRRGFSSKCRGVSGLLYPTPPPPFHQKGPPKFLHKFNNRRYKSDFPNPSTVKFDTLAMAKKMESMMPANEAQIISDTIHKCLDNTVSKQDLEKEIITINSKISGQDSKISVHDAELKSYKQQNPSHHLTSEVKISSLSEPESSASPPLSPSTCPFIFFPFSVCSILPMELSRFMRSPQARDPIAGSGTRQIPTHWRDFARALQEQVAHAGRCRHRRRAQKHTANLRGFANLLWKQLDHLRLDFDEIVGFQEREVRS